MPAVQAAEVIGHTIKIVENRVRTVLKRLYERSHVETINRRIYQFIHFLLTTNLSIRQVEEARALSLFGCFLLGEATELNDHDFGDFVDFKFLSYIAVFFAAAAVELIVAVKHF